MPRGSANEQFEAGIRGTLSSWFLKGYAVLRFSPVFLLLSACGPSLDEAISRHADAAAGETYWCAQLELPPDQLASRAEAERLCDQFSLEAVKTFEAFEKAKGSDEKALPELERATAIAIAELVCENPTEGLGLQACVKARDRAVRLGEGLD